MIEICIECICMDAINNSNCFDWEIAKPKQMKQNFFLKIETVQTELSLWAWRNDFGIALLPPHHVRVQQAICNKEVPLSSSPICCNGHLVAFFSVEEPYHKEASTTAKAKSENQTRADNDSKAKIGNRKYFLSFFISQSIFLLFSLFFVSIYYFILRYQKTIYPIFFDYYFPFMFTLSRYFLIFFCLSINKIKLLLPFNLI